MLMGELYEITSGFSVTVVNEFKDIFGLDITKVHWFKSYYIATVVHHEVDDRYILPLNHLYFLVLNEEDRLIELHVLTEEGSFKIHWISWDWTGDRYSYRDYAGFVVGRMKDRCGETNDFYPYKDI